MRADAHGSPDERRSRDGAAGRADRTARLLERVDAHLRSLGDDAARRAFLAGQQAAWERRYARFVATQGGSESVADPRDPPDAADFLATITALAARRMALAARGDPASGRARQARS